jgi:hypothetical protein
MTLWDLLLATCVAMPIVGALAELKDVHHGWIAYPFSVVTGLIIGLLLAWIMRTVGSRVVSLGTGSISAGWRFRALYGFAILWILFALFVGGVVARTACRFL